MSNSTATVKDLYKVINSDLAAYLNTEKSQENEPQKETIQQFLDRFIKNNAPSQQNSTPTTSSSAGGHIPQVSTPIINSLSSVGFTPSASSGTTASSTPTTPGSSSQLASTAVGQRNGNELWYQTITNNAALNQTNGLPFVFHRIRQTSLVGSPPLGSPSPQTPSTTLYPNIGGALSISQTQSSSGNVTQPLGATASIPSPSLYTTSASFVATTPSNTSLAAQRLSSHLITLYAQHLADSTPIANVSTRIILYLTHLLPFLTPQLIISDWWDRLIEPSLQGEIKLEKDALKACRDLVVECMNRDSVMDNQRTRTGLLLVAGDEEGQMDWSASKATMPVSQFVLRKYIMAAYKLNHRVEDFDLDERELKSATSTKQRTKPNNGHASSAPGLGFGLSSSSSSSQSATKAQSEYSSELQETEIQNKLLSDARAIIRRKKDILIKNLETILFSYGSSVGRTKDFFNCLYTYFVGARFRPEILGLLCQFIRRQRVHLHQILATPLFDSIILSLKYDTSPLIVSLGLMILIMLMPRITTALNDRLLDLFLILNRIICWPKSKQQFLAGANQHVSNFTGQTLQTFDEFSEEHDNRTLVGTDSNIPDLEKNTPTVEYEDISLHNLGIQWRRYGPSDPGRTDEGVPDPTALFTFLYGLFPCNLLKFLHSPRLYTQQIQSPSESPKQGSDPHLNEGESKVKSPSLMSPKNTYDKALYIDEDLLKSRVKPLLKRHSLHPAILKMTDEIEIADKTRWQKLEPMEIVAMCVGLDVWSAGGLYGMGPLLKSIEDDRRGVQVSESDCDSDDNETIATHPQSPGISTEPLAPSTQTQVHPSEQNANASVESLESFESEGASIGILAQHDLSGSRVSKENQPHLLHPTSASSHTRAFSVTTGGISPRPRLRSREVKMSHILKNFATLRGIDYDEYITEAYSGQLLGPNIMLKDRRPSLIKDNGNISSSGQNLTSTSESALKAIVANHSIIPAKDASDISKLSSLTPEHASLAFQNQEYRRTILQLERELLMARNELNFELFLKQQHIQQISKVHRAHVLDASVEAERQNLYNTCRSLKAQLQETKLLLEKEKNEMERRKNKQTHWDNELKNKMQTFRDERKQLQFEVERLKQEIKDTQQSQETQERLLIEERKGTFQLRNVIEDLSPKLKQVEEYEKRIEEMTRQLALWETENSKTSEMQRQIELAVSKWQSAQLLLSAEKEEARILRNKVSQQSQVMDDMRIQLAINEGRSIDAMAEPHLPKHSASEALKGSEVIVKGTEESIPHDHNILDDIVKDSIDQAETSSADDKTLSAQQKSSNENNRNSFSRDIHWTTGFARSSSSYQGFDNQKQSAALQGFMAQEKEKWDKDLQDAKNRWKKEAARNQDLEDRILELQGQLELTRAIDVRQNFGFNQGQGGTSSILGSAIVDHTRMDDGSGMHLIATPSQPRDVPYISAAASTSRMKIHDQFEDIGNENDDDGFGSGDIIGRYSNRHEHDFEDDGMIASHSVRRTKSAVYPAEDHIRTTRLATDELEASNIIESSTGKEKNTKSKFKSRWLVPAVLERAQSDQGIFQSSLAINSSNPSHMTRQTSTPTTSSKKQKGVDTNLATRTGSSSAAARATSGGLFPPIFHTRSSSGSHLSDGNSDIASTSDNSSIAGSGVQGDRSTEDGIDSGGENIGSETSGPSKKSKTKSEKELEREKEREKERIQLIAGVGPLVAPSKMYRNVRMF